MQKQQENVKINPALQASLGVVESTEREEIQRRYHANHDYLKERWEKASSQSEKDSYRHQLESLEFEYQTFLTENSLSQSDPSKAADAQAVQNPPTPAISDYRPFDHGANSDQNSKTYILGPRLSGGYVANNFKEDADSIAEARSMSPAQAEKYDLLKSMDPPVDVKFGLLKGEPAVLVTKEDAQRAREFLNEHGYQQVAQAQSIIPKPPTWAKSKQEANDSDYSVSARSLTDAGISTSELEGGGFLSELAELLRPSF